LGRAGKKAAAGKKLKTTIKKAAHTREGFLTSPDASPWGEEGGSP